MESSKVTDEFSIIKEPPQAKISDGEQILIKFTEFEERRYNNFLISIEGDEKIFKKFEKNNLSNFLKLFLDKKEEVMRFLNIFKYDVDYCLQNLVKLGESMNKLKITDLDGIKDDGIEYCLKFIDLPEEKDKTGRQIILVNFSQNKQISSEETSTSATQITKNIIYLFEQISKSNNLPRNMEQFTLLINMEGFGLNNFIPNFDEIIKILQYKLASRIHKIFLLSNSQNSSSAFININRFLFVSVREKIIMMDMRKLKRNISLGVNYDNDIENHILKDFFMKKKITHKENNFPTNIENLEENCKKNFNLNVNEISAIHESKSQNTTCVLTSNKKTNITINQSDFLPSSLIFAKENFEISIDNGNSNRKVFRIESQVHSFSIIDNIEDQNSLINLRETKLNVNRLAHNKRKTLTDRIFILDAPRNDSCCKFESCGIF